MILRLAKNIIKVVVFLVGLLVMIKLLMKKLEDKGIIKREWIVQKTPSGKGIRYAMSILDRALISFQI